MQHATVSQTRMTHLHIEGREPASFRDPAGFLFRRNGELLRQINFGYRLQFEHLLTSGLYQHLIQQDALISHVEVHSVCRDVPGAYKIIRPDLIPFISYPYEWCFTQLKAASLATLRIEQQALRFGMSLKDASAYNIQFRDGKPVFIDTLSFELYHEGLPWVAYRQFCEHFLTPLVLMSYADVRLNQLLRVYVDGIPMDLAVRLLPWRAWLSIPVLLHLCLHAFNQRRAADLKLNLSASHTRRLSYQALLNILKNLESAVQRLHWRPRKTSWARYYPESESYSNTAISHKKRVVAEFLDLAKPKTVWDFGANTGLYSRIASACSSVSHVVAWDSDQGCVEVSYRQVLENRERGLLPLVLDLTNPSPSLGWQHAERMSLQERGPVDAILALALVHHLLILNNVSFEQMAAFFAALSHWLIIEFVPKDDPQVRQLLLHRGDAFPEYTRAQFESAFANYLHIRRIERPSDSQRVLYLMESV